MTTFYVDMHIHSRFSRATSSRLTLPHLAAWGQAKGLQVIGTGDFTHPGWREELSKDLVRDDASGLYRLRPGLTVEPAIEGMDALGPKAGPLFLLQAEISSIYKKDGKVRKVHNLVYLPDLESAERFSRKLEAIGNLASDGRPILGLDSAKLLEILLETDERGVLIPAHIWTPWFSLFGSKSGFDNLNDCFGDLSEHVFALETGLSSDPDMNRLWSHLDAYALVSNSDAHSGENLARETNIFCGTPSYDNLFNALRHSAGRLPCPPDGCDFVGTLEFFPEEGKYHLDGHRACNVVLEPEQTVSLGAICPVCAKPLTVGVLHRVMALADRTTPHHGGTLFHSLVPLPELLGECLGVGPKSRKVAARYADVLRHFGSELRVLQESSESDLRAYWEPLGEAIARMRRGQVIRMGGYDGEYGTVRVFDEQERAAVAKGRLYGSSLLDSPLAKGRRKRPAKAESPTMPLLANIEVFNKAQQNSGLNNVEQQGVQIVTPPTSPKPAVFQWTPAQESALRAGPNPILVMAGPGSGKTRTLVGRMVHLLEQGVLPEKMVAVTFTRRAAAELCERIKKLPQINAEHVPQADTLHALALSRWPLQKKPAVLSEEAAWNIFVLANKDKQAQYLREAWAVLSLARERLEEPISEHQILLDRYTSHKNKRQAVDYTDLLENWLKRIVAGEDTPAWQEVLVDEVQDLSLLQLTLLRALLPRNGHGFFGIGDPDQAIYAFRGAHGDVPSVLSTFWNDIQIITLRQSYRSAKAILSSAHALLGGASACGQLEAYSSLPANLHLFSASTAPQEAAWIAEQISRLVGSGSHTLTDRRKKAHKDLALSSPCSFGDIAILVRLKQLAEPIREALQNRGIPCAIPEAAPFWQDVKVQFMLALAGRRFGFASAQPVPDPSSLPSEAWTKGPQGLLRHVEHLPPFDEFFKDSKTFTKLAHAYTQQGSWEALLFWVQTRQELDEVACASEHVQIMTLHASKGLEFRAVFLPALEEGLIPFSGPKHVVCENTLELTKDVLAEERRLLYVGLTRAEEAVFASHATERMLFGRIVQRQPSRFIADMASFFQQRRLVRHRKIHSQQASLLDMT